MTLNTGLSPSTVCVVRAVLLITTFVTPLFLRVETGGSHDPEYATHTSFNTYSVWAHSFSLAATKEVVFTFLSWRYLDVSVPSVAFRRLCIQRRMTGHYSRQDLPFGHPRINAC